MYASVYSKPKAVLLIAVTFGLGLHVFAQTSERIAPRVFKTDSNLVLVPVTVINSRGALVNGLRGDAFRVWDNKVSQQLFSFAEQDAPASIGVILDMSGSMKGTLPQAKVAVRSFLDTANSDDEAFLYSVSSRPARVANFTADVDSLMSDVAASGARGSTALIDTIYCGLDTMRSAKWPRKALLIISDGMDNHSRYSKTELMERVLESDVQIYTIAIYNAPAYEKAIQLQEEHQGLILLEDLAAKTGGLNFTVRNSQDIVTPAATISRAIRNQYTLGYVPRNPRTDGKWHSIRVKLGLPGVRVYARSGYYAQ
jgi:Ca-activated chloride channel homolog